METLIADLRQALRSLGRAPGFAAAAIGILALGIAANTAVFSVADAVLFRPLAYDHPEQLVLLNEVLPQFAKTYPQLPVNAKHYYAWQERLHSFSGLAILDGRGVNLTDKDGPPERLGVERVSWNLLRVLGVRPQLGRDFRAEEDRPGNQRVVIITEPLWRRRFHGDPGVLNKTIMLDGTPHQVIGVLPASFHFPRPNSIAIGPGTVLPPVELFRPLALDRSKLTGEGDFNYTVIGRLREGVSREQAVSELNVVETALAREGDPSGGFQLRGDVTSLQDRIVSGSRRGLLVLLASIGVVLLIVCVNLGNLMLARATARAREMAVRAALGASSWRMIRQVLTESLAIALAGGVLGMMFAYAAVRGLVAWAPVDVPRLDEVHLDWRAVLFAFGASALAGVLFGLIPAWRASRSEPQDALRSGGRSGTESRHGLRISELLVSAEVALSAALLVGAGLLIGSLVRVLGIDQGFHADNVLTATLNLSSTKYREDKATNAMLERLTAAVQRLPGVKNAGIITALPLQGETWVDMITREDDHRPMFQRPAANYRFISPDYFAAMGIPIVRGRTFREGEKNSVMVSAGTAARIWPGENAVGKHMRRGNDEEPFWEVIGVVADTRAEMQGTPPLMVYRPYQTGEQQRVLAGGAQRAGSGIAGRDGARRHLVDRLRTARSDEDHAAGDHRVGCAAAVSDHAAGGIRAGGAAAGGDRDLRGHFVRRESPAQRDRNSHGAGGRCGQRQPHGFAARHAAGRDRLGGWVGGSARTGTRAGRVAVRDRGEQSGGAGERRAGVGIGGGAGVLCAGAACDRRGSGDCS